MNLGITKVTTLGRGSSKAARLKVRNLSRDTAESIIRLYAQTLNRTYGPQNWWPAKTPFEVIIGTYLTQDTSWKNVEGVIGNLRKAHLLTLHGLRSTPLKQLELLIRPSGYFRQKAARLKIFIQFVDDRYGGSLKKLFRQPTPELRGELLALPGVGPETADSILLYAANREIFVVDTYTRRILARHGLLAYEAPYDEIRELVERALAGDWLSSEGQEDPGIGPNAQETGVAMHHPRHAPSPMSQSPRSPLAQLYNNLHALIVRVGSSHCRKQAICEGCPLRPFLPE